MRSIAAQTENFSPSASHQSRPQVLSGLVNLALARLLPAACLLTFAPCRSALACQLGSWFNAYCLVRTYSNSLEAVATIWASHLWQASWAAVHPAQPRARALRCTALAVAAAGVVIRPSSALTWVPLGEKVAEHAVLVGATLTFCAEGCSAGGQRLSKGAS